MKRTVVVTGATSGLGQAAAVALAKQGWRVIAVGRDAARGAEVVEQAKDAGGETAAEFVAGDLFTMAGVRRLAAEIRERAPRLDLLINNAGGTFGKKTVTKDGLELTFALNVMAPFLLTDELIEPLAAAKGRVVNLVTGIPKGQKTSIDDLATDKATAGIGSYSRNKLALAALTKEQHRRYAERGVTVVSLHPGVIPGTRFGQDMPAALRAIGAFVAKLFRFGSTLDEAADRYLRVGTGDVEGGAFYAKGEKAAAPDLAESPQFASEVWSRLDRITHARA